ncbi:hypothetical protein QF001_004592 [Paraburkholderia youngii]
MKGLKSLLVTALIAVPAIANTPATALAAETPATSAASADDTATATTGATPKRS